MQTLKIKLGNIFLLDSELNGMTQPAQQSNSAETEQPSEPTVILKGLINEILPLSTKFWLLELNKELQPIKESINSLREELIKKYGTVTEDGAIFIPVYKKDSEVYDENGNVIEAEVSEEYTNFQTEFSTLLSEEKEIKYMPISLSVLDKIETDKSYSFILQNLIEKPE
jgi:hypothetical protein